jgi:hypothetical protein
MRATMPIDSRFVIIAALSIITVVMVVKIEQTKLLCMNFTAQAPRSGTDPPVLTSARAPLSFPCPVHQQAILSQTQKGRAAYHTVTVTITVKHGDSFFKSRKDKKPQ